MLVSIVTPSLNSADFLEETIQSVLSQDYPNIEYIVVDGGSSDGTVSILDRYKGRLEYSSAADEGAADAINTGFRRSRGAILAWLGADDRYLPGAVSSAVQALRANPAASAVYGEAYWIDEAGRRSGRYPTRSPYSSSMFRTECCICQPACFMRREAVESVGLLDTKLHSAFDYDLWIRITQKSTLTAIPNFLAESRMHIRNKSLGQKQLMFEESIGLLQRHYGYVPPKWVYGYLSFLRDGTDQFYSPLRHCGRTYFRSLLLGSRWNAKHLPRYWGEWLRPVVPGALSQWNESSV